MVPISGCWTAGSRPSDDWDGGITVIGPAGYMSASISQSEELPYIRIRHPTTDPPEQPPLPSEAQQAVDTVIQAWEAAERAQANEPIQPEAITDANPWLRFTQWAVCLRDIPPDNLLQSIAAPDPDGLAQGRDRAGDGDGVVSDGGIVRPRRRRPRPPPSDAPTDPTETAIQALWETVDQLARKSRTVQHCGSAIRMEAVRTQQMELPYHPLLAYMDDESIQRHVYLWQEVLTFFARTQLPHDWKSPGYDFTPPQRQKWQRLWAAMQVEDVVLAAAEELQPWIMTAREQACLEFCVELLNQRQRSHEYESAVVCAMAVLGRSEEGWRTPDSYLPFCPR